MQPTLVLTGVSGLKYVYGLFSPDASWNPIGGNYAFVSEGTLLTGFSILYIGETESFKSRMPTHSVWPIVLTRYFKPLIYAHTNLNGAAARKAEERDLIAAYNPPENIQHRTGPAGGFGLAPSWRHGT